MGELFGLCQGGVAIPKVLFDDVEPSCTGGTSWPPPPCRLRMEFQDGSGWVFWREAFNMAEPTDTVLGCDARGRRLLGTPSHLSVGDMLRPMNPLDGA